MKTVSQLDENGFFVSHVFAKESPLEPGTYLIPGGAVDAEPPAVPSGMVALWDGSGWLFVAPEQKSAQEPPVNGAPQEVTAFQARAALAAAGLLGSVNTYMASLPADNVGRLAWEYARTFKRTSPTILALAPLLGMDDAQLDQLFITAAGIDA